MISLHGVDRRCTTQALTSLDKADSALLHCIQDGTSFLESIKAKFDVTHTGRCLFCEHADSLEHRALSCQHFSNIRSHFPEVIRRWHSLPKHVTHHGLLLANQHLLSFWEAQHALSDQLDSWEAWPHDSGTQHIFVDGSCDLPKNPQCALAGWSCYLANTEETIAAALLPFSHHTSDRAEIWAIVMALDWAAHTACQVHIYSDSQYALDGFAHVMRQSFIPTEWRNQDLWKRLQASWERLSSTVQLTKVSAHLDPALALTEHDAWLRYGNSCADSAAKAAVRTGGSTVLRERVRLAREQDKQNMFLGKQHQLFLLHLAKHSLASRPDGYEEEDDTDPLHQLDLNLQCHSNDWTECFPVDVEAALSKRSFFTGFGSIFGLKLSQWIIHLDRTAVVFPFVTLLEVFIGFHLFSGLLMPLQTMRAGQSTWVPIDTLAAGELVGRTLASNLRVFELLFSETMAACQRECSWGCVARPAAMIHKPMKAVQIPWPEHEANRVADFLWHFLRGKPLRYARELARQL